MADSNEKRSPDKGDDAPEKIETAAEARSSKEQLEHVVSVDMAKDRMNYDRVDDEVAEYAGNARIEIDEQTDTRLRRMIHKRVLVIMIVTYFMQALDKGTMSFTSIMDLREDTNLHGQQV